MGDISGKQGKCVVSPFVFTLCLCVAIGFVLIIVPFMTFANIDYAKNVHFGMTAQFFMPQMKKFDSLVYSTKNGKLSSLYVFKSGTKLQTISRGWAETYTSTEVLENGDVFVFPYFYVVDSYVEANGYCPEGCLLEIKDLNQDDYDNFEVNGRKIVGQSYSNGLTLSNSVKYNATSQSFGKNYLALINTGKSANVTFSVNVKSPIYNVSTATPIESCVDVESCKLQKLPKDYFAVVDIQSEQGVTAAIVSLVQQHNDDFRWGFPSLMYVSLILIVIVVGIGQLIYNCVKRNRSQNAYTTVEDPLAQEQEDDPSAAQPSIN